MTIIKWASLNLGWPTWDDHLQQNNQWRENPNFLWLMHWVYGLMQKPNFCEFDHGFILVAAMRILAANYHQGWETPTYFSS
jgi:hypothetical protein